MADIILETKIPSDRVSKVQAIVKMIPSMEQATPAGVKNYLEKQQALLLKDYLCSLFQKYTKKMANNTRPGGIF